MLARLMQPSVLYCDDTMLGCLFPEQALTTQLQMLSNDNNVLAGRVRDAEALLKQRV